MRSWVRNPRWALVMSASFTFLMSCAVGTLRRNDLSTKQSYSDQISLNRSPFHYNYTAYIEKRCLCASLNTAPWRHVEKEFHVISLSRHQSKTSGWSFSFEKKKSRSLVSIRCVRTEPSRSYNGEETHCPCRGTKPDGPVQSHYTERDIKTLSANHTYCEVWRCKWPLRTPTSESWF